MSRATQQHQPNYLTDRKKKLFTQFRKISTTEGRLALGLLRMKIQETVTRTSPEYNIECDTSHDVLVELKAHLASTRRIELIIKYRGIQMLRNGNSGSRSASNAVK
jgi:hypothetical protein